MSKKISEEDKKYIRDNWYKVSNAEIAKRIGVCSQTITVTGRKLGLEDKRELIERAAETDEEDLQQIEKYKRSSEAIKEEEGRRKTLGILDLKNQFKLGQELKFKSFDGLKTRKTVEGKVIQKTEHFVVVKAKNEIISLAYRDFYTRRTIII